MKTKFEHVFPFPLSGLVVSHLKEIIADYEKSVANCQRLLRGMRLEDLLSEVRGSDNPMVLEAVAAEIRSRMSPEEIAAKARRG